MSLPRICSLFILAIVFQGCLATWIHMEDGTVLQPGRTEFGMAAGMAPRANYACSDGGELSQRPDGTPYCVGGYWTYSYVPEKGYIGQYHDVASQVQRTQSQENHAALAWRLGVLGPFGPFTGLEAGLQAEGATNPVSQEFKLALGLPGSDSVVAHSLIGGWGIGMWADDSWFLQYAASRRFGICRVFGSVRGTLQASQTRNPLDTFALPDRRTWDWQVASGVRVGLGNVVVLPDWVVLTGTLDLSHKDMPSFDLEKASQGRGIGAAWALGMGWTW